MSVSHKLKFYRKYDVDCVIESRLHVVFSIIPFSLLLLCMRITNEDKDIMSIMPFLPRDAL